MTGSGKTTFLDRLLRDLDPYKRIVTVEDTRELIVGNLNRVHILMSRTEQGNNFTYNSVRDLIVRMTPDIVLAGELSTVNAATIWDLMTTGHGHFMTTIHAESAMEAINSFITLIGTARSRAGSTVATDAEKLRAQMLAKLRVIQVARDAIHGRHISEIL